METYKNSRRVLSERMALRTALKRWYGVLRDPKGAYAGVGARTLEDVVVEYLKLLCLLAILLAIFLGAVSIGRALVYAVFYSVDVQYERLVSYTLAGAAGGAFFAIFAGTFLLFFVSLLARPWYRNVAYVDLIRGILLATAPLLLFGWIAFAMPALLIWSLVLFVNGMPILRAARRAQRGTIRERE
jgi:hypothetical protein